LIKFMKPSVFVLREEESHSYRAAIKIGIFPFVRENLTSISQKL
jgi:hypothetical protein